MASLNLSINGPSIKSSYQGVVNGPPLSSSSSTFAQWALFSVQAPLANAFQDSGGKESVLKVQGTGGTSPSGTGPFVCRGAFLTSDTSGRGGARRAHRRLQRGSRPVRLRQSQGSQHRPSQERAHSLVRRGRS